MSENKYLVYLNDKQAKNNGCISGWYIHSTKVKKIEKKLMEEFINDLEAIQDNILDEYTDGITIGEVEEKWEERKNNY